MSNSRQLLARLKSLLGEAGRNYYERIKIAESLLTDRQWVASEHGGDDYKAAEVLEDEYFHDLCGLMGLWDLLHIYRRFPELKDWEANGFHLRKMFDQLKAEHRPVRTERRTARVADLERLEAEKKDAECQLKKVKADLKAKDEVVQSKDERIAELESRVKKLEAENLRLRGRIEQMEAVLDRFKPARV